MSRYAKIRLFLETLDPVHIGTGGYRLGRVDNAIVREPGSNLPKFPGTALSGVARSYAAMRYGSPQCAGQGQHKEEAKRHCSKRGCPICYSFGSLGGTQGYAGMVNIYDAMILLFPISSMIGPIWISTARILKNAGFQWDGFKEPEKEQVLLTNSRMKPINLGWLMLPCSALLNLKPPDKNTPPLDWEHIKNRIGLVSDQIFSTLVNSNLEVRTSVAIDPFTGAASNKALFTYEAVPRGTWMCMEIVEDDFGDQAPWIKNGNNSDIDKDKQGISLGEKWKRPKDVAIGGLKLAEWLGIGGMGTRGFGRIKIIAQQEIPIPWEVKNA